MKRPSQAPKTCPYLNSLAVAAVTALLAAGLAGCKPDQAQGYVASDPPGVAVFRWERPSDADVAAATTGSNRWVIHPAEVNDDAGLIMSVEATYDAGAELLAWTFVCGPQPDGSPWHATQGFWLVLSDGPMPRSLGGDTAQFIFDASGPEPEVSAYVYNGQPGGSSWMEGPSGGPPEPIVTSRQGAGVLDVTVSSDGDYTVMSFTVDASIINDFVPIVSPVSHWRGVGFDHHVGIWFHPLTNVTSAYGPSGYLEQLEYERTGWLDGTNFFVERTAACCLPDGTCTDLLPDECEAAGGTPASEGTECATTTCPGAGDCCEDGKPSALTLQYVGGGCADSYHGQDPKKVECEGGDIFAPMVRIVANDRSKPEAKKGKVWFDGDVPLDGTFTLSAAAAGEDHFKSSTFIHVLDPAGDVLQTIRFHTSCSQPLVVGDRFASVRLVDCGEDPGEPVEDCCEQGKPTMLTLQYVGGACELAHHQDAGKVSCVGDSEDLAVVRVVANDESSPDAVTDEVYHDGEVALDGTFSISAGTAGKGKIANALYLHVFDVDGRHLQTVGFHMSCSQPLVRGDRYGSLVLVDCGEEPSTGDPGEDCCADGRPTSLSFEYTGADCGSTSSGQDPAKLGCTDAGPLGPSVYVSAVAGKSGEQDFGGTVSVGEVFLVAPTDKLSNETVIRAYDMEGGTLLQEIRFHTSCSQPLQLGDQFGAFRLVACNEAPAGGGTAQATEPSTAPDECDAGKPAALTMRYVGADCTAMSHGQKEKKVRCTGDARMEPAVRIVASNRKNHEHRKARIYFDDMVLLDDLFTIDAGQADRRRLSGRTYVLVYDLAGELLQTVELHTSCSQPLGLGDQFGSVVLEGFIAD